MKGTFLSISSLSFVLLAFVIFPLNAAVIASAPIDLSSWKLQIPGPKEIKDLMGYSSVYFERTPDGWIVFHLGAAEKGHTPNTHYVRSELRHLLNWDVSKPHILTGAVSVDSHADPDKVTVLQIHGITDQGDNAPPLLRVAVDNGDVYAHIKRIIPEMKLNTLKCLRVLGKMNLNAPLK